MTVNGETYTWTKNGDDWTAEASDGHEGNLTYDKTSGIFTYTRPEGDVQTAAQGDQNDQHDSYDFHVEIKDSDGDTKSSDVTVNTVATPEWIPGPDPNPDPDPDPDTPDTPTTHLSSVTTDDSYVAGGTMVNNPTGTDTGSATDTGSFGVTLTGDEYTITITDKDGHKYTLELDKDGNPKEGQLPEGGLTITGDYGNLTITDVSGGHIEYTYTQTKSYEQHGEHGNADEAAVAEQFGVTLSDEHDHTLTGHIDVSIEDDMPVFGPLTQEPGQFNDRGAQKSLDFVTENETSTWSDFIGQNASKEQHWGDGLTKSEHAELGGRVHWGLNNGFKIIATSVTYNEDGTVTDIGSQGWQKGNSTGIKRNGDLRLGGQGDTSNETGKNLWLTKDGLGVGGEHGVGGHEISGYGQDAEAVVLEVNNGSVSYGFDITFGDSSEGKVLISFYLTPRNNDDNDLVMQVVVDLSTPEGRHFFQKLPDGFNKVIISPLPKETDVHTVDHTRSDYSSFTIDHLDITRPSYVHEGQIPINPGADGLKAGSVSWNWNNSGLDKSTVKVNGEEYTVTLSIDGNIVTAVLSGGSGDINLNGNTLFTGTLNENGSWSIERFYDFQMRDADDHWTDHPWYNVTFSATDTDGDTATTTEQLNLFGNEDLDRFDNVETGYWNDAAWNSEAKNDNASDWLFGGADDNDLMFGKGGKDVLFGDGSEDALKDVLGDFFDNKHVVEFYVNKNVAGEEAGDNGKLVEELYKAVGEAFKNNTDSKLESLLTAIDKQEGGDDALYGGVGDDILFAGAGNDYLNGGPGKEVKGYTDHDILFGGAGNDIILYDKDDLIHGGADVDILLANKGDTGLLNNGSSNIKDVEVVLRATDTDVKNLGITSSDALNDYGITMDGNDLTLSSDWSDEDIDGIYEADLNGHHLQLEMKGMTQDGDHHWSLQANAENAADTISSSPDSSLKFVADVSSLKDSQDDDPLSVDDGLNGSTGSDTLFADSGNDDLSGSDALSAGDELIQYDPTDYAVFGGDNGIAVLLSNDTDADSLDDLLKAPLGGDKPHVQDVELFLKGEGVEDLTRMSDLQQHGITVDEESKTVTLGEGWKKAEDGSGYVNEDNNWTLETSNVTVQGVDEAAQQAANEIQLTQQG
ncbi:hypothetical protein [uncultured Mailhella sp.]|uniref:hypothetical protein n=1 Tax=uncultured Mailhella sp. TaxID=1981031 RepID=UPI0026374CF2|nr:hypothetical protein [uncultured Mailhella sp.]